MESKPLQEKPGAAGSLSRRFSYVLMGVVALILIAFAAVGILFNIAIMDRDLETRLEKAMELARRTLPTTLWNLDRAVTNDFIEALFLDENIIHIRLTWGGAFVTEKKRPGFDLPRGGTSEVTARFSTADFISNSAEIQFEGQLVGQISIVMSRHKLREQAIRQVYGIIALMLFLFAAIWVTSVGITRRYISLPLLKLQASASQIAGGDLDAHVDKGGTGEIGILSQHLEAMRGAIKQLFEELSLSKEQLQDYSRNLEEMVELRTRELAQSVEELEALGEVSQAVNSTLDLEKVLSRIVQYAVQLSQADAGTIYEFDERDQVFTPRINYGVSRDFVEAARESRLGLDSGTAIGRAALKKAPVQIADLTRDKAYGQSFVVKAGFQALLAAPLTRGDRLIGGLVVRRKTAGAFSDGEVNLLQTFAAQSVLAIHNARLFSEIEEKKRQLEEAGRHKSEFLANMSHELRTPLNAILGYTELIQDGIYGETSPTISDVLERLEKNGRHLLRLINEVLDLSKIEAGRLTLSVDEYLMRELLLTAYTSLEALAAEKKLEFHLVAPEDLEPGRGDEQRIAQVLLNLVGNAIKFTDEGRVTLSAEIIDGMYQISVSDTGPGLSEAEQEKVFEEFHQADGSSTRKKDGAGLGLAIAKKIVELHKGRIWVESTPGKGAVFRFTLPIRL